MTFYPRILAARGLFSLALACSTASGQVTRAEIMADTGRPVARAVELLESRHPGVVITYEDARYSYADDVQDVTQEVRRDLHLYPPGQAPKVLVPTSRPFQFEYAVSDAGDPRNWKELLESMVSTFELGGAGGRFSVEQIEDTYHIVPVEIRNTNGEWVKQPSVLDATISLNRKDARGFELLNAIVDAVSKQTEQLVGIGTIPLNVFGNYFGSLEAENEPARQVLLRLLSDVMKRTSSKLSWQLFYGPDVKYYALNIHAITPIEPRYDPIPVINTSDDRPGERQRQEEPIRVGP